MARDFIQANADGTYSSVHQDDAGNYTYNQGGQSTNQAAAQNITYQAQQKASGSPSSNSSGGSAPISAEHRQGLITAGYPDANNPNLTEDDWARIAAEAQAGAGGGPGGMFAGMEYYNNAATLANIQAMSAVFQKAYWDSLIRQGDERLAFDKAREAVNQALQVSNLVSTLSGPANAFQQQEVLHGLDNMGVSKAVGFIRGDNGMPQFQAPQAEPVPLTLESINQMLNKGASAEATNATGATTGANAAGSTAGSTATSQSTTANTTPTTPSEGNALTSALATGTQGAMTNAADSPGGTSTPTWLNPDREAYRKALPNPNKIVGRNWMGLDTDTQNFLLSSYGAKGYSANSVLDTIKAQLPKFTAPSVGTLK